MTEKRQSAETIVWFGKYKGQSIQHVLDQNPEYLIWARLNVDGFLPEKELVRKADELRLRNRRNQEARCWNSGMNGHPGDYGFSAY